MDGDLSEKLGSILSDPSMMEKIKSIAQGLGASAPPPPPPIVERKEERLPECENCPLVSASIAKEKNELTKNLASSRALLVALKPFLDKERCERIDKILGMIKIAELMGHMKQ